MRRAIILCGIALVGVLSAAATVHAAVPSLVSVKLTGQNTLTVVYSEPVQSNTWDYTNFTGNLSGLGVVSITGSGTNVISLTLNGSPSLSGTSSGYLSIGTGVISLSTNSPFPGGTFNVTSAQTPILSSVSVLVNNINNAFSTVGSQITLTFSVNESVVNPTVTILGHTIGVNGNGSGPYTVNYVVASGDAQGTINATLLFTDMNGNTGSATVNILSTGSATTANSSGYITSNANSSGVLYPGNSITFTLVPSVAVPGARGATGSYNGIPLSWYTTNNGSTFTAVYTVAAGQSNTTYPLQISGVTITDQNGNIRGPFSGSDVQKTITAAAQTSPVTIYQSTAVPSVVTNTNPSYSFVSTAAGTIHYGGDCLSGMTSAVSGMNTVVFNTLAYGLHSNCTITVTDTMGNLSNQLVVSPFTVQAASTGTTYTPPTPVTTPTPAPTTATLYKFSNPLKVGSTGTDVTQLQIRLTSEGVYTGPINGKFGPLTEAAVKKYQTAHGLTPLGSVGPGTRAVLNGQ